MRRPAHGAATFPVLFAALVTAAASRAPASDAPLGNAVAPGATISDSMLADDTAAPAVVEEAAGTTPEIFRASLEGSLYAGGEALGTGSSSFLRALGAGEGSVATETWIETSLHLGWRLPGDDGFWSFSALASPLFGSRQTHGDSATAMSLQDLREAWISARYAGRWDLAMWAGRRSIEPGAGLYSHPMYVLPIQRWAYSPEGRPWEENNAVLAELSIRSPSGLTATARWFPELTSDTLYRFLYPTQSQAVGLELAGQVFEDHSLRATWFRGAFQAFGGSWEWVHGSFQMFSEASLRGQPRPGSLESADPGIDPRRTGWRLVDQPDDWWVKVTAGPQLDFDAGPLQRLRISLEYVWSQAGWETSATRDAARALSILHDIPASDSRYPEAMALMQGVAGTWDLSEAYRHRAMLRLSSVESMSWSWALNLVGYGPSDALMGRAELDRTFADAFTASISGQMLLASRDDALFGQMPEPWRVWGGLAYSFGQDKRSRK